MQTWCICEWAISYGSYDIASIATDHYNHGTDLQADNPHTGLLQMFDNIWVAV